MPQNVLTPARKIGKCVDALCDIRALLDCQSDALLGLAQHHSDQYHHLTLSYLIADKVKEVQDELDLYFKTI